MIDTILLRFRLWAGLYKCYGLRSLAWPLQNKANPIPYLTRALMIILKKKQNITVLQVGAHTGNTPDDPLHSLIQHAKNKKIPIQGQLRALLIEPVPYLFEELRKNYSGFPNVQCLQIAVGSKRGTENFYYLDPSKDLSKAGMPDWLDQLGCLGENRANEMWNKYTQMPLVSDFLRENRKAITVNVRTINEIIEETGITPIDLLQIDAEGADGDILRSLDLETHAPHIINYEHKHLGEEQNLVEAKLKNFGYVIYHLGQNTTAVLGRRQNGI